MNMHSRHGNYCVRRCMFRVVPEDDEKQGFQTVCRDRAKVPPGLCEDPADVLKRTCRGRAKNPAGAKKPVGVVRRVRRGLGNRMFEVSFRKTAR